MDRRHEVIINSFIWFHAVTCWSIHWKSVKGKMIRRKRLKSESLTQSNQNRICRSAVGRKLLRPNRARRHSFHRLCNQIKISQHQLQVFKVPLNIISVSFSDVVRDCLTVIRQQLRSRSDLLLRRRLFTQRLRSLLLEVLERNWKFHYALGCRKV